MLRDGRFSIANGVVPTMMSAMNPHPLKVVATLSASSNATPILRHEMGTTAELIVLVALLSAGTSCSVKQSAPDIPLTFEGSSPDLKATEVVATLDAPIPKGKNAIWCASFQSAWKALEELAGGPIGLSEMLQFSDQPDRRGTHRRPADPGDGVGAR